MAYKMNKSSQTKSHVQAVMLRQLKDKVNALVGLQLPKAPKQGWVRTIREALDMSGTQLAERLNFSRNKVSILERKEADGSITINQLKQLASGLDCDVVYAIVPKQSIDSIIEERAHFLAGQRVNMTHQNMFLEAQQLAPEKQAQAVELLANEIKLSGGKVLWKFDKNGSGL